MKRVLPGLALVFFLGCLVLGYLLVQEKTKVMQVTVRSDATGKEAEARIADLQQQVTAARIAQAAAEKSAARVATVEVPVRSTAPEAKANGGPKVIHLSDIMKDHPEYVALYAKQTRRNIDRTYGDGLNTLNLPADQLAQLKDLLAERQMNNIDAQGAADAAGLERNSPAWQEAMKQAARETEQQITAIVGPDANSTLEILQARGGFQTQVETVYRSDFVDAGVPLTPEQSNALVQALSDTNYTGRDLSTRPPGYNDSDPATGITPHEKRILDLASRSLTPAQLQVVRTDLIENRKTTGILHEYTNAGAGAPMMILP